MTFKSNPTIEAILDLIFAPDEYPVFVDGTAPLEEMVREPESFIVAATERFGFAVKPAHLKLTIIEFAELIGTVKVESER